MMLHQTLFRWLTILALGAAASLSAAADEAPAASVLVETVPVARGSLPRVVEAFGVVQPDPQARAAITAPAAAVVAAVHVRVGDRVARGAPLVDLIPSPQLAAGYAQALSAVDVAEDALRRTRSLAAQSLATETQVAAARKSASDAQAALAALRAQGGAGRTTLRAPFAAAVTAAAAVPRALVAEGAPLVELARPDSLALAAGMLPGSAAKVRVGDAAGVTAIGGETAVRGVVSMRGAVVDPANGLVPVAVRIPAGHLMPGESAVAAIRTELVSGFVVPHATVLVHDNGDTYVVQDAHGVAKLVPVRVLLADGARDVIAGALDAAAPLVVSGNYQLDDGMKLRHSNAKTPVAP